MGVIHKPECTGQDPNTSLPIQDVPSVAKHNMSMKYNPLSMLNIEQTTRTAITADPGLDLDLFQQEFCEYMGFDESIPVPVVINQIIGGLFPPVPENKEKINYILAFVVQENPASLLEAQMLVQLFATHQLYTKMLKKATDENYSDSIEKYVNIAMKVSRVYKNSLDLLAKFRRAHDGAKMS